MSLLSISPSPAAALPAVNFHPHGHRRTSNVDSGNDSSSDTAAQVPVAAAQNLFGTLLQSLEAVVGLQSGATAGTTATNSTAATGATAAAASATGASATTTAADPTPAANAATAATSSTTAAANAGAAASAGSAGSTTNPGGATANQSANSLLQNYLNNQSQKQQADGAQLAKFVGSAVRTKV